MANPPAVAEKVSYSRGSDGRACFGVPSFRKSIDELKQDTLSRTGANEYMQADASFSQIDVVRQQEKAYRMREEDTRQHIEKGNLARAYRMERDLFEVEWAEKIRHVDEQCADKLRVLEEVHQIARQELRKEVRAKVASTRFKASSTLLQLEDTERRLARLHEFKQAAEVQHRAQRLRKLEETTFLERLEDLETQPLREQLQSQQVEMRNATQRCHGQRVTVQREREQAFEVLKQKYRNLEADLGHAHIIEFNLPAEIGSVQAQRSRSQQASTFRGTLKYESLAGTKFDVPDVSRLPPIPTSGN